MSIHTPADILDKAADSDKPPPAPPPNRKARRALISQARRVQPRGPMTPKKDGERHKKRHYIKN